MYMYVDRIFIDKVCDLQHCYVLLTDIERAFWYLLVFSRAGMQLMADLGFWDV